MQNTKHKTQNTKHKTQLFSLIALLAFSSYSHAGLIRSASSVTTTMGSFSGRTNINSLIDQAHLSSSYISGVTDFDTYVSSQPTHRIGLRYSWLSAANMPTGDIDFDLGDTYIVSQIVSWFDTSSRGINQFTLFADDDGDYMAGTTTLGTFGNDTDTGGGGAQVFNFTDISTRYLRLRVLTNLGSSSTTHYEVAFDTTTVNAVPVPAAVWLMGSALLGLMGFRKKAA